MNKSELRQTYLEKQKSLSDAERKEKSRRIAAEFFEVFELGSIRVLHVFLPIEKNGEVETAFIFKRLWEISPDLVTVAPCVDFQTLTLENRRFASNTKLVENKWHILEPANGEIIHVKKIDAVLVPLLCFDERGFRVGYGKGFYDKLLSECRADCLKIGLSYFAPVAEISDTRDFDVKLDYCVRPSAVYDFTK
ncbi:MAG: 5-formyltetrahydrofolate cyclo-ligase [Acidobacteriota bacterium]|nr:5-formyltetrahydrofolate cyclo-ligase [Acidobacteriota bacterium]